MLIYRGFCDSLECEVVKRTGTEVLGVVQADRLSRTADTGDARQVTGGATLAALPLLIWEQLIINLLSSHHTLGIQIHSH